MPVTDCNLLLGGLHPRYLPPVFGPRGDDALDNEAATRRLDAVIADASGGLVVEQLRVEAIAASPFDADAVLDLPATLLRQPNGFAFIWRA